MDHKPLVYLANGGKHWVTYCEQCFMAYGYLYTGTSTRLGWQYSINVALIHYFNEHTRT